MAGLDNWQSERRYRTLEDFLKQKGGCMDYLSAAELLSGKTGFLCQYDRTTGKDTVWSVIYDLASKKIYRAEGNPSRCCYKEDLRFPILN